MIMLHFTVFYEHIYEIEYNLQQFADILSCAGCFNKAGTVIKSSPFLDIFYLVLIVSSYILVLNNRTRNICVCWFCTTLW